MQKGQVLIFLIIGILIIAGVGGYVIYTNYSNNRSRITPSQNPVIISQTPQPTPSPSPDETANWKIYTNKDIYFKYPSDWNISGSVITSNLPKIRLVITAKDGTLMNECMEKISEESKDNLFLKRFTRVTTGAMCGGTDPSPREIWVIPSKDAYAPGISYEYSATESKQAEEIFNQIISTFKFTQ